MPPLEQPVQSPVDNAAGHPLPYRLLTGPDDRSFCARVSAALAEGYELYGNPSIAFDGERVIAAQAVVLKGHSA
jgi:hypothetical protein